LALTAGRRHLSFVELLIFFLLSGCAQKALYPQGPIHIVVPHDPGGVVDTSARLIQPYLQKYLGVPVVIDNMPGAGGNIGRAYVFRQPADGYTLMVNLQPSMSAGQIVTGANFDSLKFTHIYNIFANDKFLAAANQAGISLRPLEPAEFLKISSEVFSMVKGMEHVLKP